MRDCDICGAPMVWSLTRCRVWCAIGGDHVAIFARLVALCDEESAHTNETTWPRLRAVS